MLTKILRLQSGTYWTGILFLLLSLVIFFFTVVASSTNDSGVFLLNFSFAGVYFILLLIKKNKLHPGKKIHHWVLLFILFFISAWSLNRELPVFDTSVSWMTLLQAIVCLTLVVAAFYRYLPPYINHICCALLGFGLPLFIYLTMYLFPIYLFSVIAAIALGVSLHSFSPLLISVITIVILIKMIRSRPTYIYSFFTGLAAAVTIAIIFCIKWAGVVDNINREYRKAIIRENADLPLWLQMAQYLPQDEMTEKVLKTGIVYVEPSFESLNLFWNIPNQRFDEPKKHDPLITLASMFTKTPLGDDDKIRILETAYNNRHQAQERLWSGEHLITSNVFTNIKIWPQWQLAYIEKTLTVKNTNKANAWPRQEEAIYTFYLPEGSVVSSLSLWINGVEEKGVMTTKEKAALAYKTIVGVESRDPSVIHWQEGNTVSVRVFPVMAADNRMFKIGVTTPLIKKGDKIFFQNIYFKGPEFINATEDIKLNFDQLPAALSLPAFLQNDKLQYSYGGSYQHYWQLNFAAQSIADNSFYYKGKSYSVQPYQKQIKSREFKNYFLDINSSWTKTEMERVLDIADEKPVYVFNGELIRLDEKNKDNLFEELSAQRFSFFPVYNISQPENSLLITKGNFFSPNLSDIKSTPFEVKLNEFIKLHKKLYVVNLNNESSPYLKTLREYRVLDYEKAGLGELEKFIKDSSFPADQEDENKVIIKDADLAITRTDTTTKSNAPDHLLRLFSYNNIMRQVKAANAQAEDESKIIEEAKVANIVSPVSSLIVLETQQDYERFNIDDSRNGLQNASHKKSGAVPEPHEWVLIALAAGLLIYLICSSSLKKIWHRA